MEIRWLLPAAEDLERLCAWIDRDNPEAARRVAGIIYDGCAQLKNFPNIGRASRRRTGINSGVPYLTAAATPSPRLFTLADPWARVRDNHSPEIRCASSSGTGIDISPTIPDHKAAHQIDSAVVDRFNRRPGFSLRAELSPNYWTP